MTKLGHILDKDEFKEAEQLAEQWRQEVQKDPRMLDIYRYVAARLEVSEEEADLLGVEYREQRKDITAKPEGKEVLDEAGADQGREKMEQVEEQKSPTEQARVTKPRVGNCFQQNLIAIYTDTSMKLKRHPLPSTNLPCFRL